MTTKEGFLSIREALLFSLYHCSCVPAVTQDYLTTNSTLEAMGDTFPSAVRQRTSSL